MEDLAKITTTHISTNKKVEFKFTIPEFETQYPATWFQEHPGDKPPITVPLVSVDDTKLVQAVAGGIKSLDLTVSTAKAFLYKYFKEVKNTLTKNWVSFGVEIGKAGESITPWNLVKIVEGESWTPTEPSLVLPEFKLRGYAFAILAAYRLNRGLMDNYLDALIKKMTIQIKAEGGPADNLKNFSVGTVTWMKDQDFLRMVAAIDMYLYYFKSSPDSILRMATLGSRYKDCTGLVSFGFAMKFLSIPSGDLIDWIFVKAIGEEILRLTKEGQEIDKPESYFPYQSDFKLVEKSAYSAVANPNMFHWIHILGALLGHKRSINARFNFEGSLSDIGLNAVVMMWAFGRGSELSLQFSKDGKNIFSEADEEEMLAAETEQQGKSVDWLQAQGRQPSLWFGLLKVSGFSPPLVVRKQVESQRGKIKDPRDNSVGEYVRNHFLY